MSDSRIAGLYRMSIDARVRVLVEQGFLGEDDARALLAGHALLPVETANRMIENVIGVFGLPFAIAPNFLVNGKEYIVPMVVEEPSVVAGVSGAAKLFRESGGFSALSTEPVLAGQILVTEIDDPDEVVQSLSSAQEELIEIANARQPKLVARGGGARDIEYFKHQLPNRRWTVVLHLLVDTRDAMGANVVNTMCEALAFRVSEICGGKVVLRILSNLADKSVITARGTLSMSALGGDEFPGEEIRDGIVLASDFANTDPYRAATHNKGIMNGIDAVAIATGNDWRAIEAGAHAFAVRDGAYRSLSDWSVAANGDLVGELIVPLKVGIVGGTLTSNPGARTGLAITGVSSATELAELMGATGLAQNFAALRALVTHGIQKGHMSLHARSVAASAGVADDIFDQVVSDMIASGEVKAWKAEELAASLQGADRRTTPDAGKAGTGQAAGKVILLGEHAAVYDRHVLALPLPAAVTATVTERPAGMKISIPGWGINQEWSAGNREPVGAAAVVALIMRELNISDRGFDIRVAARIPTGVGLGSSAAFAVAVIRAFDAFMNLGKSDIEVDRLAFRCEEITHGTPSGIDNRVATFGQPVLFSKSGSDRTKPIKLREVPPLVIASSSTRAMTRDIVAGVRARFGRNRELYTTIFDEIDVISIGGADALRECDYDRLGSLMNVCHGFLNAIEVSTPELEKMVDIARRAGAVGAKLTGAGCGGSIVALSPGKLGEVADALRGAGYRIVTMSSTGD